MKLVVGLGNFGDKYAYTFHNMGFLAAECLADRLGMSFKKRQCDAVIAKDYVRGEPVVIAKPVTYMNLSGNAVLQLMRTFKAGLEDLIVIFDDVDIKKGEIRVRQRGSAGTHNGMRHIIATLKSEEFARIRIGIGPVPAHVPIADYVLSEVPKAERETLSSAFTLAAEAAETFLECGKVN